MKPRTSSYDVAIPDPGSYRARNFWIIDLGTQKSTYMNVEKDVIQVLFGFELSDTAHVFKAELGEQPFMLSSKMTNSIDPKANMRAFLESWMGRPISPQEEESFDIFNFGGKAAWITCVHKKSADGKKTYANIGTITPLPKEVKDAAGKVLQIAVQPPGPSKNTAIFFEIGQPCYVGGYSADPEKRKAFLKPCADVYQLLPAWVQKVIALSPEWIAFAGSTPAAAATGSDFVKAQSAPDEF